mgnify:FL=1
MDTTTKLKVGFAALMILSGIGVASYPVISNAVAQRHASEAIQNYDDTVKSMDTEKLDAAKEAARQSLLSEYDGVQLTEAVRLRSAADNDTAPSLTIDSGKVARLNDYQDGWYQVTFGQSTGYIPAEYAQPVHYADYEGTSATNTVREELIAYAYTYLGTPYVYGGSSYSGTDCSGFTMAVFAKFGYSPFPGASDQYYTATSVSSEERQAGDLVFFDTFGGISHVGIYLGGGQFIHASSSGGVKVNSLYESYYAACYLGAGRILP